jgi:hypothetical protein
MTMADIWLTAAAGTAFSGLQATAPSQAVAVNEAINDINVRPGQPIDLPGAPPAEPFLAKEPNDPRAPVVIYRRATTDEEGDWLVVSLMNRDDYRAARQAEQTLALAPPAVRNFVNTVVGGTVASITVTAPPGTVTSTPQTGGAAPTTDHDTPGAADPDQ